MTRNAEHYPDPTAGAAMANVRREERMSHMTPTEIVKYYERQGKPLPPDIKEALGLNAPAPSKPVRRKYGNNPTEYKGVRYDSAKEARRAQELDLLLAAGEIVSWRGQVPFALPGGVRYYADFVILERGGRYRVEDVKSQATARDKTYRLKRRQMRECLGIEIEEV